MKARISKRFEQAEPAVNHNRMTESAKMNELLRERRLADFIFRVQNSYNELLYINNRRKK